ncbi:MAG: hypothetical protein IPP35_05395 [Elusimicrobia bacterium]|nr:hypothetical protein [Elusimicrobiota bacterium]
MMAVYDEEDPCNYPKGARQDNLALLIKCRDAMLEVLRLTGENLRLNKEVTGFEAEVKRLKTISDYLIDAQSRGR